MSYSRRQIQSDIEISADFLKDPKACKINSETGELIKDGDIRGVIHGAQKSITKFEDLNRQLKEPIDSLNSFHEKGSIVIYTTSMTTIRNTFQDCQKIKAIFVGHRVKFIEKDICLNKAYYSELEKRLEGEITVPIVFIDGELIGDVEIVFEMNETGELKQLLKGRELGGLKHLCKLCNGTGFILCTHCDGSKNSIRNDFTDEIKALKCISCNEIGLIKCPKCSTQE